ncbi:MULTISPECIES: NAD-dependent epimerase/dehydratase family protein [unclassified Janthinobacterium]|uniref:NAD-dependent epimerase/dehydratase family protein n=1 Tax=unclassified Janthinobacterium TaxID=2610881 RepID=UPI0016130DAA|nr:MULTISPECIES: NAD-dependent epimerase/dehydratase family protein [unclassified Janthinobacterium]MBB5371096.1 nucleoside-diphosphate-sugar epimerase [Janthinobacterium sp. K2C7]MBB5383902.1 nucleoside-diphosphate-sugar epimerase [Janthinobacterium sp. K2Li3]MBB5389276.1 nucleoside-diphosphate-sugar epimerase [Janthinobacterium sp. K2E3]
MQKILVTGANGFVGKMVCAELLARGFEVIAAVRKVPADADVNSAGLRFVGVGNVDADTDWDTALAGCSGVIHLAARAHILNDDVADPLAAFRATNVAGTLQLARSAARAGVARFVFVSSVGVNGNQNQRPFTENDTPLPAEPYAVSKLEAELALQADAANCAMELVIVRPPLVYGPGCPGNFLRLLKVLSSRIPMPFGAMRNKRSFIGIWNLADFLATCLVHEKAAGQVFLISDLEDVTLPDLLRGLARGMGSSAALFSVPPSWLAKLAGMAGRSATFDKLGGALTIDASRARTVLGWTPPVSLAEGLQRTGRWYAER